GRVVEVMSVERQPGLEPQRIARAEPGWTHFRLGAEQSGNAFSFGGWNGDLEPVLTAVAGSADPGLGSGDGERPSAHEGQRGERPLPGRVPIERRERFGPLKRQER